MEVFHHIHQTAAWLARMHRSGTSLGFVPTMGALHEGHLDLVKRAVAENDLAVCSIFVNPIQFNNPDDLAKYPRTMEADLKMLEKVGCHMVFAPSPEEMYPEPPAEKFDFGLLEQVMEGLHRPGHFNGVAVVVKKLFGIIQPDRAYFGEKDFQQLRIIQALVEMEEIPVIIVPCPTVREYDGLAMSSRNRRLNGAERAVAPEIYQTLLMVQDQAGKTEIETLKLQAKKRLKETGFILDYFEIAASGDLQPLKGWDRSEKARALVACFLGNVRLIDNLELIF